VSLPAGGGCSDDLAGCDPLSQRLAVEIPRKRRATVKTRLGMKTGRGAPIDPTRPSQSGKRCCGGRSSMHARAALVTSSSSTGRADRPDCRGQGGPADSPAGRWQAWTRIIDNHQLLRRPRQPVGASFGDLPSDETGLDTGHADMKNSFKRVFAENRRNRTRSSEGWPV